jgi:hypothetical protein
MVQLLFLAGIGDFFAPNALWLCAGATTQAEGRGIGGTGPKNFPRMETKLHFRLVRLVVLVVENMLLQKYQSVGSAVWIVLFGPIAVRVGSTESILTIRG